MNKFIFILGIFLCLTRSARAWNAEGHMVVAQIAYNHLNSAAKAKCDALVAMPVLYSSSINNTFVTAACWADDIKSHTSAYSIWHYIDLPFSLDGTSTSGVPPDSYDVVRAIHLCITNLQNVSLSQSNQAFYLRFLLHFVGDIQQPLHCSTAVSAVRPTGDAGGNTFYINNPNWSNLHSLWDSGGGFLYDSLSRPLGASDQGTINAKVFLTETNYPYDYTTNINTIPDPMTWAQEGLGIAQSICYTGLVINASPSSDYLNNAMAVTEQRMAQGGHRLADLLNSLYPANIIMNAPKLSGTNFLFSWIATSGNTYQIQWKKNLTDSTWNVLTNLTATTNSVSFTDNAAQAQRFYRVSQ